jgi:hypothetical protein
LGGLLAAGSGVVFAEPPPGTVSLWEADKGDRGTLKFGEEWGWPAQYTLKVADATKPAGKVRFVGFSNIPSASRIILSSDEFCAQNDTTDFWIELGAFQEHANYPAPGDDPALPMAALMALQKDQVAGGLRVINTHHRAGASLDGLTCVRMITSRLPGQTVPDTRLAVVPGPWVNAPDPEDNVCDSTSPAIVGRRTTAGFGLHCASPELGLKPGASAPQRPRTRYKGGYDVCPANTVITGFGYRQTPQLGYTLACRGLLDASGRPLQVVPVPQWHGPLVKEGYDFTCPDSTVLIGRKSELGAVYPTDASTWYLCGDVRSYRSTVSTATTPQKLPQASIGTLRLWSAMNPQNGTRTQFPLALDGPGTTRQYELQNHGVAQVGDKRGNNGVEQLAMEDIPSAAQITLTDDPLCDSTKGDFAVTLKAWKEGASLPQVNISDLGANDLGYPVGEGLRLEARRGQPARDKLSCIKVEVSREPGQVVPSTPVPFDLPQAWQSFKESGHDFTCSNAGVLLNARRAGDENGEAAYRCGTAQGVEVTAQAPITDVTESGWREKDDKGEEHGARIGIWVMCPFDQVLIGRGHKGDENGKSQYTCATLTADERPLAVKPDPAWQQVPAQHEFTCDAGKALVGRWHEGDETKPTAYRCGTVLR